jgi:hypothetical protein
MKKNLALLLSLGPLLTGTSWAHEGHGALARGHWHATDLFGFIVLAVVLGALAWWTGRK